MQLTHFAAELQEIKHDISSLRYEIIGNTSRTAEKIRDLWHWLRPNQTDLARPSSSFEKHDELEAIIEQTEEYGNVKL